MGRKILLLTFTIVFLVLIVPKNIKAENIAGNSANIAYNISNSNTSADYFKKKLVIKKILERYNSTLGGTEDDFMATCLKYNLDCYLLPAISGVESTFGRFTYQNSHNPFGWGRGLIIFNSWAEAIDAVGKGLKENYINKGADTVEKIGAIYCEGNTWSGKVSYLIDQFIKEEENIGLFLKQDQVKL